MRRRDFITLVGGAAAWPLAAWAQQAGTPIIGFLNGGSPDLLADRVHAFHQGLGEAGYVEGRNLTIEYRWAEDHVDRLPALAADLVRRGVAAIAATGATPPVAAAKAVTATIPIVFQTGADPVALGLVASLNRPGGNVTGFYSLTQDLMPKLVELLHEMIPASAKIGLLTNPTNPVWRTDAMQAMLRHIEAAARTFGLELIHLHASSERDFDTVFATVAEQRIGGLVINPDPFFGARLDQLAALAGGRSVPAIYNIREFVSAGGLMSYGASIVDMYRLVGVYTGRILKGEKPADLPVQQATKVELILNLRTAKALNITVPLSLLTRADELIE
jgi:putative tryptophan/tyrosine transport system substrate-binding protein